MNYLVLDIIDDKLLSLQLYFLQSKAEISELLNWKAIHSETDLSLYALYHDGYDCIFNTALDTPSQIFHSLKQWEVCFKSQDCTIRPVLRACINSLQTPKTIFYISNNIKRWTSDLLPKCRPFFLSSAPESFFPVSVQILFKDLFDTLVPIRLTGKLIISNEAKVTNGQFFDIDIEMKPVVIPLKKLNSGNIEIFVENVVKYESVSSEFVFGNSWVVFSVSSFFSGICKGLIEKDCCLIVSSEFDLDECRESPLPVFYVLIPAVGENYHLLMKKVPTKERVRNLEPRLGCFGKCDESRAKFLFENFEVVEFSPRLISSGLHQFLFLKASEQIEKAEVGLNLQKDESEIEAIINRFAGSIKKKRGRKPKDQF